MKILPTIKSKLLSKFGLGDHRPNSLFPSYLPGDFIPHDHQPCPSEHDKIVEPYSLCVKCEGIRDVIVRRRTIPFEDPYADFSFMSHFATRRMEYYVPHHSSLKELNLSARAGCRLCSLLISNSRTPASIRRQHLTFGTYVLKTSSEGIHYDIGLRIYGSSDWHTVLRLQSDFEVPTLSQSRSICTASNTARQWCRRTLENCVANHNCFPRTDHALTFLPTRLLDLGLELESERIYLICPKEDEVVVRKYAALSYCWGLTGAFTLTQETIKTRQAGILVAALPKTCRDTIEICRSLGYRYLWIDALCIQQDSAEDWNRESRTMSEVYRNAALTIAALGAPKSSLGCFALRNILMYENCLLGKDVDGKYLSVKPDLSTTYDSVFKSASLCRRGWTFQERLLSARTLYFGELLMWECHHHLVSELGGLENDLSRLETKSTVSRILSKDALLPSEMDLILADTSQMWKLMVEGYTRGALSVKEDRPIAINGLIDLIHQRTGLLNVAGFWKTLMEPKQLLWIAQYKNKTNDRAPSWSWLAVDAPVTWEERETSYALCSITKITMKKPMTHERVTKIYGELHLNSPIHPIISIRKNLKLFSLQSTTTEFGRGLMDIVINEFDSENGAYMKVDHWPPAQEYLFVEDTHGQTNSQLSLTGKSSVKADALCDQPQYLFHGRRLAIFQQLYFLPIERIADTYFGLILSPAYELPKSTTTYRRVGVMQLNSSRYGLERALNHYQHQDIVII